METEFQKQRRTILIVGAGIAGLACALFVARAGYRVEIFERSKSLDPIGAGIQLSPNAMHVLATLGLERQIKSVAIAPAQIDVHDARSGKNIASIPLGTAVVAKYEQPYLVIHRADLQNILLAACNNEPDIEVKMGVLVRDAVAHPNGISIIADTISGTVNYRGAALIGADGVHSIIRSECFDVAKARSTHTVALRAMVRTSDVAQELQSGNITMWLGTHAHAVVYPVRAGRYHNIILTVNENFSAGFNSGKISGHEIATGLPGWNDSFKTLLDINTDWTHWPLFEAPVLKKWHEGCVMLIGDAAHAMTPHAAQGAAMALEDAAVLGYAMGQDKNLQGAFALCQGKRKKRVDAVCRFSTKNRIIYQLPIGLAQIRNLGMRAIGGTRLFNRQDWIYRWRPIEQ